MTTRDAAHEYIGEGWSVVPIPARQKAPVLTGWQRGGFSADAIDPTGNVGFLMGEPSGGRVDVDLDHPLAVGMAREFLPATGYRWGRKGNPDSHWIYQTPKPGRRRCWTLADGKTTIVELRGTGCQTVAPPSIHPSGEQIEFVVRGSPAGSSWEELEATLDDLAAAVRVKLGDMPADGAKVEQQAQTHAGGLPGEDFSRRGDIRPILEAHGWALVKDDDNQHWRRPEKNTGASATYNGQVFYVFTSNAAPFTADKGYSRFAVYCLLEHNGDFKAGAKALASQGYGSQREDHPGQVAPNSTDALAPKVIVPEFKTVRQLLADHPSLRESVIHGLLRKGETMNIIAPSKQGKSWLVVDLAIAMATGRNWLDTFMVEQGDVLILDNELHPETTAFRIPKIAVARGIDPEEFVDHICVESLRGRLLDLFGLHGYFAHLTPGRFKLVVLDAWYRFMPEGHDENDNAMVSRAYNFLDSIAGRLGCCFVLIHHASKGSQANKSLVDVGAGAGAQSRATDTHLVLRTHESDTPMAPAVVLEAAVRSWQRVQPRCLVWTFPVWNFAPDLDPTALKPDRPRRHKAEKPVPAPDSAAKPSPIDEAQAFVAKYVRKDPTARATIIEAAVRSGLSDNRAKKLLAAAEGRKLAFRWTFGSSKPVQFATIEQQKLDLKEGD
jgi:hypothetical protein